MKEAEVLAVSRKHSGVKVRETETGREYWINNVKPETLDGLEKGGLVYVSGEEIVGVTHKISLEDKRETGQANSFQEKDKRITRLAVLNTATKIVEIAASKREELPGADELTEAVKMIAEDLERWVYR